MVLSHLIVLVLFLRIRLSLDLTTVLLAHGDELLQVVGEVHLDKHAALAAVLSVPITNGKEVLVERLADVGSQYEIVLVLLVDIVH